VDDACKLGWGAAGPQAMLGAKAAGHHGVPEVIQSFATDTKNLGNFYVTDAMYQSQKKYMKGRCKTQLNSKLVCCMLYSLCCCKVRMQTQGGSTAASN